MFLKMLLSQARHRWQVTALLALAMTALVSLYVYVGNSARFSNRSMQLIMKHMGHNAYIVPERAEPRDTYLCTEDQVDFPDEVTPRMAEHLEFNTRYYASVLQQWVQVDGHPVVLTGVRPVHRADESAEKPHLTEPVPEGCARLGARAAELLGCSQGDEMAVGGRRLTVTRVLESQGSLDDYRVYVRLSTAQELLRKPGRINVIWAFLCMHFRGGVGRLAQVMRQQRERMGRAFPGYRVLKKTNIARGRDLARRTTSGYLDYLLALVFAITVVIIAVTGLQEVSERRREIGILLAMGAGYVHIVGLYLAKLFAIALVASVVGFAIGSCLSREFLSPMLVTNTRPVAAIWSEFPRVALLICLVVLVAALLPMAKLVRLDPNVILTEE
ncbi:MAG: ABC transporter permease [Planctomycetota bacterium]